MELLSAPLSVGISANFTRDFLYISDPNGNPSNNPGWYSYRSAGISLSDSFGVSALTLLAFPLVSFSVASDATNGPVYGLQGEQDYLGWYIVSTISGYLGVGMEYSAFRAPNDSSYGWTVGPGFSLSASVNITIGAQYYWADEGDTQRLQRLNIPHPQDPMSEQQREAYFHQYYNVVSGQIDPPLWAAEAPGSAMSGASNSETVADLSAQDPRLTEVVNDAVGIWQSAIGRSLPFTFSVTVGDLTPGMLGETVVTTSDSKGRPTSGQIILSQDAAGLGWFIDLATGEGSFAQMLTSTAFAALPGSAAYGHYDLLTVIEHEIGHLLGFVATDQEMEDHVETIDGSQVFVAPGVSAPVFLDGDELDPDVYPDHLMAASLALGVRKLPSALEVQIINTVLDESSPAQYTVNNNIGSTPAAAVDRAVASLTSAPPVKKSALAPVRSDKHGAKTKPIKTEHGKKKVTVATKPKAASHKQTGLEHKIVIKSKGDGATGKQQRAPDGGIALSLSHRGKTKK